MHLGQLILDMALFLIRKDLDIIVIIIRNDQFRYIIEFICAILIHLGTMRPILSEIPAIPEKRILE